MINRFFLLALLALTLAPTNDPVTGPAGTYTVTTSGPTRVTSGDGWVRIEWQVETTPSIPTPPAPGPSKPVEPPPVVTPEKPVVTPTLPSNLTGQVWMLAVYDIYKAEDYPPGQKAILLPPSKGGSATIGPVLAKLNISWQPRNINDPVLDGSSPGGSWKSDALKQGLPCVIVISDQGGTVQSWSLPLPADEAAVIELGKKITGR